MIPATTSVAPTNPAYSLAGLASSIALLLSCLTTTGWLRVAESLGSFGHRDQVLRGGRQDLAAVLRHHNEVLDADAEAPGYIDPRLDGHALARDQLALDPRAQPRLLMDLEAHPMPEPVAELLP